MGTTEQSNNYTVRTLSCRCQETHDCISTRMCFDMITLRLFNYIYTHHFTGIVTYKIDWRLLWTQVEIATYCPTETDEEYTTFLIWLDYPIAVWTSFKTSPSHFSNSHDVMTHYWWLNLLGRFIFSPCFLHSALSRGHKFASDFRICVGFFSVFLPTSIFGKYTYGMYLSALGRIAKMSGNIWIFIWTMSEKW